MHTLDARDIAGGRDDTALATADNDGTIAQAGIVALFHAGVKRVAVHMSDRQVVNFAVKYQRGDPHAPHRLAGEETGAVQSRQRPGVPLVSVTVSSPLAVALATTTLPPALRSNRRAMAVEPASLSYRKKHRRRSVVDIRIQTADV